MMTMLMTPNHDSLSPVAGWLSKMTHLPFGRSRWNSRFFVLLDSELRFYKDEHSESAAQVLSLRKVYQVIPAPTANHPYCFRLEPKQQREMRPWIIECKSETDMNNWVTAIKTRILKYTPVSSPSSLLFSPTLSPKHSSQTTVNSIDSLIVPAAAAPEFYRMPTLPLRCTNLTKEEVKKDSLLMRRNKKLAPIVTLSSPLPQQQQLYSDVSLSSAASSCSSALPSPTGAVLGPLLISPSIIDRYSPYNGSSKKSNSSNMTDSYSNTNGAHPCRYQENADCDTMSLESSSSPTYLMYKKKFRL